MPNLKDAQELTAPLEELIRNLKSELSNSGVDFERLVQIAVRSPSRLTGSRRRSGP